MLGPNAQPIPLQRWYDRLAALVAKTREQLREIPAADLVRRSGCTRDTDGALCLQLWDEPYRVRLPGFGVERVDTTDLPTDFTQALLLTYLFMSDGTPPLDGWITYRDLPDGMFYAQAFRGYAEVRLVRELGAGGIAAFCRGMERLGGQPETVGSGAGNAAYALQVLPRIRLAAVYWLGDEDFPSQASVLFQETAPHYLSTDGLAVLGSHLVNRIIQGAFGELGR
jgi:hypothetical protein